MISRFLSTRALAAIAWASLAVSLTLMALRVWHAISLTEPLTVITSGAEEETALSLWHYIRGQEIYRDPHRIPFAGALYNWLFYGFYGEIIGAVLKAFSLAEIWLLTVARFITLAWTAAGAVFSYLLFRRIAPGSGDVRTLALPFAVLLFFGPLVGFWSLSLNMDVAATVCGVLATLAFCRYYDSEPVKAVVVASLLSYLAWSFKQSHIFIAITLGVFLLVRRDWRGVAVVSLLHGAGWGIALLAGSEIYVKMMLLKGMDTTFTATTLGRNVLNLAVKTTPFIAAALAIPLLFRRRAAAAQTIIADTTMLFALCGFAVSAAIAIPLSGKIGASENYYFSLAFFMVFAGLAARARLPDSDDAVAPWRGLVVLGWLASAAASGSVLTGMQGVISNRGWHDNHVAEARCLRGIAGPVFTFDPYLALPWMTAAEPRFLLLHSYSRDRAAGRWFERDGVGGLIREGYFASIVLGKGMAPAYDGARLDRYVLTTADCAGLDIYRRK